jgi:hypothetical protein
MRTPAASLRVLVLVLVAACDPIAGVSLRQSLRPAPAFDCVRAALAASPLVAGVQPLEYQPRSGMRSLALFLRDTVTAPGAMPPRVDLVMLRGDTTELRVFVGYFGATTSRLKPASVARLTAAAEPIARLIRAACAPDAPVAVRCIVVGWGRERPCEPAT